VVQGTPDHILHRETLWDSGGFIGGGSHVGDLDGPGVGPDWRFLAVDVALSPLNGRPFPAGTATERTLGKATQSRPTMCRCVVGFEIASAVQWLEEGAGGDDGKWKLQTYLGQVAKGEFAFCQCVEETRSGSSLGVTMRSRGEYYLEYLIASCHHHSMS
jgi:hypothetical protein